MIRSFRLNQCSVFLGLHQYTDIKEETAKLILRELSFPAQHYWRIFDHIAMSSCNFEHIKTRLSDEIEDHFNKAGVEIYNRKSKLIKIIVALIRIASRI